MCLAENYSKKVLEILNEAGHEKKDLIKEVHECDLQICALLREIEVSPVGGLYNAYNRIKELREIRIKRRKAKDELLFFNTLTTYNFFQVQNCQDIITTINHRQEGLAKRKYCIKANCSIKEIDI